MIHYRFNNAMRESEHQLCITKIETLRSHLDKIASRLEKQAAENARLRDVLRLAETELEKRREEIRELENEISTLQRERNEARARVEHAIGRLDQLMQRPSSEDDSHG